MIRLVAVMFLPALRFVAAAGCSADVTPAEHYAQIHRIEQEVGLLKRHFHITTQIYVAPGSDLKTCHIRAKSYILINKFANACDEDRNLSLYALV
jgi:hypothetical protein